MKIAIIGYGKMGRTIEKLASQDGHETVLKISSSNRGEMTVARLRAADVAIEFSRPETAFENITACLRAGLPVVSGTTAWLDRLEEAKQICEKEKGAFLYASNFSIGVNLFFALSRYLARLMEGQPQYDVQMEEIHHLQKLDHPSGTAITLAEHVLQEITRKEKWEGLLFDGSIAESAAPNSPVLPILSKREEGVPGTHQVLWTSAVDTIEIRHTAHSREGFAKGALQAAQWLVGKQGFFGMKDLLQL